MTLDPRHSCTWKNTTHVQSNLVIKNMIETCIIYSLQLLSVITVKVFVEWITIGSNTSTVSALICSLESGFIIKKRIRNGEKIIF